MKRSIRRWLVVCFAVVLVLSTVFTSAWSYYNVYQEVLAQQEEQADMCSLQVDWTISEAGLPNLTDPAQTTLYESTRRKIRSICQECGAEYVTVYSVDLESELCTYILCVASDDDADKVVRENLPLGSVSTTPLYPQEIEAMHGNQDPDPIILDNRYGRDASWLLPYYDMRGIVALISSEYSIDMSQELVLSRTLRQMLPVVLALLLALASLLLLVTRRLVRPIHYLSARMNSFVADRDKPMEPLAVRGTGEIAEIAGAFEKMESDIGEYVQHISALNKLQVEADVQMSVARRIQYGLVPQHTALAGPGYNVVALTQPARQVGGDFYDCFPRGERELCVLIGDVSGKGVSAALFMASAKTMIHEKLAAGLPPAKALNDANDALCGMNPEGLFATVFAGVLETDTGLLRYANAGHNRPVLLEDPPRYHTPDPGTALGLFPEADIREETLTLAPRQGLLIYTDGVTEAVNEQRQFFGEDRLLEALSPAAEKRTAQAVADAITGAVEAFRGQAEPFDDLALLALVRPGEEPPDLDWIDLPVALSSFNAMKEKVFALVGETPQARQALLACDELLTNIVSYSGAGRLRFGCALQGERLTVALEDDGIPFDPTREIPTPGAFETLDRGGMGRYLVQNSAAALRYARRGDRNLLEADFLPEE